MQIQSWRHLRKNSNTFFQDVGANFVELVELIFLCWIFLENVSLRSYSSRKKVLIGHLEYISSTSFTKMSTDPGVFWKIYCSSFYEDDVIFGFASETFEFNNSKWSGEHHLSSVKFLALPSNGIFFPFLWVLYVSQFAPFSFLSIDCAIYLLE